MPVNSIDVKTYTGFYHHKNKNGDKFTIEFKDGKPIKSIKSDTNGEVLSTKEYKYDKFKKTIIETVKDEFVTVENDKFKTNIEEEKTTTIIKKDSVRRYKGDNTLEKWFQKFSYGWKQIQKYLHKTDTDNFWSLENYYAIQGRYINNFLRNEKFKNVIYPQGYFSNGPEQYNPFQKDYSETMAEQSKIENRTLVENICKIDEEINNNHTKKDMVVYRRAPKDWVNTAENGIITDAGYVSTSIEPDAYWGYQAHSEMKEYPLYQIILPKGTPFFDLTHTQEKEMVLPRNSQFKVIDDTTLEFIPQSSNISFGKGFLNLKKKPQTIIEEDNSYISYLKKLYSTESTVFKTEDNEKAPFTIFKDSRMGTNDGFYAINDETGELFYTKIGSEQSKAEVLSSKLYNLTGINTPEMSLIRTNNGKTGLISKYISDMYPIREPNHETYKGFGMDCFLANWDAVISDNAITDGEDVYRIDLGGTLDYRAMSINGKKPFPDEVNELSTMLNPSINYFGSRIFAEMTRDELISSVKRVVDIKDEDIIQVLNEQNMLEYKDTLLKRKEFMKEFLLIAQQTPFKHNSIFEYSTEVLDKTKAESKKKISYDSFLKILKENGMEKQNDGNFKVHFSIKKRNGLYDTYGTSTGLKFIKNAYKVLSEDDIKSMYKFMNLNEGKYVDFWKKDILNLVIFYNLLTNEDTLSIEQKFKNQLDNLPKGLIESIMDTIQDMPNSKFFDAFEYYKHLGYKNVNKYLLDGKNREEVIEKKKADKVAKTIQQYIYTKPINSPFQLYRGENYEFVNTITMDNGKTLGETLEQLSENPNENAIKELNENIKRNKYTSTYKCFLSTAIFPNGYSEFSNIAYQFEIQPNCKGIYAEAVNLDNYMSYEHEFLVENGSKIQIEQVELVPCRYLKTKNHWVVKAKILPAD